MKRILIDGTYYQSGVFHGGGEYGDAVVYRLLKENTAQFGIAFYSFAKFSQSLKEACETAGWEIYAIQDFSEMPEILRDHKYDVLFSPLPYQPGRKGIRLPDNVCLVATFHGLRQVELLDYIGIMNGKMYGITDENLYREVEEDYIDALKLTDNRVIITVSEHSRYSLLQYFPELANDRIEVCYSPAKIIREDLVEDGPILEYFGLGKTNYALLVSGGIWYKNAKSAVIAYDRVFGYDYPFMPKDYKVVVTGVDDDDEIKTIPVHKDRFIFQPYLPKDYLEILYKNAHLFVYPSLNEGFGYPPLEAMKYGTLCACAAGTSITEVCGDACLYFNPMLTGEIFNRILQSFSDDIRKKKTEIASYRLEEVRKKQVDDLEKLVDLLIN